MARNGWDEVDILTDVAYLLRKRIMEAKKLEKQDIAKPVEKQSTGRDKESEVEVKKVA